MSIRADLARFSSWLCLGLQAVVAVCLSGFVLCVGADGHVELESVLSEDCCSEERAHGVLESAPECECRDTPMVQPVVDGQRPIDRPALHGSLVMVSLAPASLRDASGQRHWEHATALPAPATLRALRSIVLLA